MKNKKDSINNLDLKELTILCVDDDENIIYSYENIFKKLFKKVYISTDPIEALEIFKNNDIDIVITDYKMPKLNGIEFADKIREISPLTPIILITAFDNIEILKEALQHNITNFLSKPFSLSELLNVFNSAVKELIANKMTLIEQNAYIKYVNYQQDLALKKQLKIIKDDSKSKTHPIFEIETYFKPKDIVSGDSYIVKIEENIYIFLVDSMGKGISAFSTAMISNSFIYYLLEKKISFEEIVKEFQNFLKNILLEEETLSFCLLKLTYTALTYTICGMPPIIINKEKKLKSNNPPFNIYKKEILIDICKENIKEIFIYTDGLNEAEINNQKTFNVNLIKTLEKTNNIKDFINIFEKNNVIQNDDITIILIRRKNGSKN